MDALIPFTYNTVLRPRFFILTYIGYEVMRLNERYFARKSSLRCSNRIPPMNGRVKVRWYPAVADVRGSSVRALHSTTKSDRGRPFYLFNHFLPVSIR